MTAKSAVGSVVEKAPAASAKAVDGGDALPAERPTGGARKRSAARPAVAKTARAAAPAKKKAAPKLRPAAKGKAEAKGDKVIEKVKKLKLVRDSFAMPEGEYGELLVIKKRCLKHGVAVKKSEILRAAIRAFAALKDVDVVKALAQLEPIKTGRPAKAKK